MKNKTAKHVRQKRKKQKPGFMLQREQLHSNATGLLRFLFFCFSLLPSLVPCPLPLAGYVVCFVSLREMGSKQIQASKLTGRKGSSQFFRRMQRFPAKEWLRPCAVAWMRTVKATHNKEKKNEIHIHADVCKHFHRCPFKLTCASRFAWTANTPSIETPHRLPSQPLS